MEFGFDESTAINKAAAPETYKEVTGLRDIREVLLEGQIADIDGTIDQMISRGLLDENERESCRAELASELISKLHEIQERKKSDTHMYGDEVALYVDTAEEEINYHSKTNVK